MKESFYFGEPERQLLGTYHAPPLIADRRYGILLCNPFGQEHIRAYRLYLRLAEQLAKAGFHTMRFDYSGTGDSSGDGDGVPAQWVSDIVLAQEELRDSGDIEKISLLGLRLGASLAAMAGSAIRSLHSVVLWEPVISGSEYLREMETMQRDWLSRQPTPPGGIQTREERQKEVLGFPLTPAFLKEVSAINLLELDTQPAHYAFVLVNGAGQTNQQLEEHLNRQGTQSSYQHIPEQQVWYRDERLDQALVPNKSIAAIINWYKEIS